MKVDCTWGDGPDILVHSNKISILSLDGNINKLINNWQLDLTIEQANKLIYDLHMAVNRATELEDLCKLHDESVGNND